MSILPYDSRILSFGSLEEKAIFLLRRNKTEMEKDDYIWSRKLCFFAEENNSGEGTGEKYFEKKKNIFSRR